MSTELRARFGSAVLATEHELRARQFGICVAIALVASVVLTLAVVSASMPGGIEAWVGLALDRIYWFVRIDMLEGRWLSKADNQKASQFLSAWALHSMRNGVYLSIVLLAFFGSFFGSTIWLRKRSKSAVAGAKVRAGEHALVSARELQKTISKAVKDKARPHRYREEDLVIGRERIRIVRETAGLHLGLAGASQTGKTNAINQVLQSRRLHGEKALIVDPNGEFFSRFGQTGDVVLSLYDKRAAPWDFWCENMSAVELAKALVEIRDGMDGNSKFFQTTGRSVLASLLRVAKSQEQLWALANLPAEDLELVLKSNNELSHRYLGQGESGQASGVIATALMNLSFLKFLNHHVRERETRSGLKEVPFSIREWVMNDDDKRWVFLIATDSHWEDNRSLIRLWFDIASTAVLERNKGPSTSPIWLVCDEISTIGNLPTLPKVLDRGYKYDGTLVLGFQSLAQIEQIYGTEGARNIIQGLQNIIVFACNENQLSRELAERIGRFEVEEAESTHFTGEGKSGSRFSVSVKSKDRLSVTPDEIKCLQENHGILKLARFPPTRISFEYIRSPEVMDRSATQSEIPAQSWVELRTEQHAKDAGDSKAKSEKLGDAPTEESSTEISDPESNHVQRASPFLSLERGASRWD